MRALCVVSLLGLACVGPRSLEVDPGFQVPPPDPAQERLDGAARALARYNSRLVAMDHPALAASFLPTGVLKGSDAEHRGPAEILKFLSGFTGFRVLENRMTVDTAQLDGAVVVQRGHSFQRVTVPGGETISLEGRFTARWQQVDGEWKLELLATDP